MKMRFYKKLNAVHLTSFYNKLFELYWIDVANSVKLHYKGVFLHYDVIIINVE